ALYVETLDREGDPSGALVSIDTDGMIRAMVGGRNWDEDVPWARVNLATGAFGGGTGRQAGSAFKTFALATAVADGYSLSSQFGAPSRLVFPKVNGGADWRVSNYGGSSYGRVDLWKATA